MIEKNMKWIFLKKLLKWDNHYYILDVNKAYCIADSNSEIEVIIKKAKKKFAFLKFYPFYSLLLLLSGVFFSTFLTGKISLQSFLLLFLGNYILNLFVGVFYYYFSKKRNNDFITQVNQMSFVKKDALDRVMYTMKMQIFSILISTLIFLYTLYLPFDLGINLTSIFYQTSLLGVIQLLLFFGLDR